jgi:hypothetical protein
VSSEQGREQPINPYPNKKKAKDNIGGAIHTPDIFVEPTQSARLIKDERVTADAK